MDWELPGTPDVVHLELADGSKIRSTQKIPGVMCRAGKIVSYEDFYGYQIVAWCGCGFGDDLAATLEPVD